MFLVHNSSSLRFPFRSSSPPKSPPASLTRPFEETLAARLRSLHPLPQSSPSIALSWLSHAVHLLALTLSDAAALLPASSPSDTDALPGYLDSGLALLDACNAVSACIDRLLRRRLHLRFALRLLSASASAGAVHRDPEKLQRARESLAEWHGSLAQAIEPAAGDLVRSLTPVDPPLGKLSAVRRAFYAVEVISCLVVSAVVAVLGGGDIAIVRVPADFQWADEYNTLAAAVSDQLVGDGSAAEMEAVEAALEKMTDAMGSSDGTEEAERLSERVGETEKATEQLTDGLDGLSNAVNELFHSALGLRNTALQSCRVGPQGCK